MRDRDRIQSRAFEEAARLIEAHCAVVRQHCYDSTTGGMPAGDAFETTFLALYRALSDGLIAIAEKEADDDDE